MQKGQVPTDPKIGKPVTEQDRPSLTQFNYMEVDRSNVHLLVLPLHSELLMVRHFWFATMLSGLKGPPASEPEDSIPNIRNSLNIFHFGAIRVTSIHIPANWLGQAV